MELIESNIEKRTLFIRAGKDKYTDMANWINNRFTNIIEIQNTEDCSVRELIDYLDYKDYEFLNGSLFVEI